MPQRATLCLGRAPACPLPPAFRLLFAGVKRKKPSAKSAFGKKEKAEKEKAEKEKKENINDTKTTNKGESDYHSRTKRF